MNLKLSIVPLGGHKNTLFYSFYLQGVNFFQCTHSGLLYSKYQIIFDSCDGCRASFTEYVYQALLLLSVSSIKPMFG